MTTTPPDASQATDQTTGYGPSLQPHGNNLSGGGDEQTNPQPAKIPAVIQHGAEPTTDTATGQSIQPESSFQSVADEAPRSAQLQEETSALTGAREGRQFPKGGRARTRALLAAAGVDRLPGESTRDALARARAAGLIAPRSPSAHVAGRDPAKVAGAMIAGLVRGGQGVDVDSPDRRRATWQADSRERGEDGRPTVKAYCGALMLAGGIVEEAAACLGVTADVIRGACRASKEIADARRAGQSEQARVWQVGVIAAMRAGDTGAMALWARYQGHKHGILVAGDGSAGGTAGRSGGDGGNGGTGGELIDLGREVRGLLDVTDRELVEALRVAGHAGGGSGGGAGAPASGSCLAPADLAAGLSLAAVECLRGAGAGGAAGAVSVIAPNLTAAPVAGAVSADGPTAITAGPALPAGGLWARVLRSGVGKV